MDKVGQIFETHVKRAWSMARALTGNAVDADDLVQQAFAVAVVKRDSIPDEPWPWLAAVISNCARNMRRKNAKAKAMSDITVDEPAGHEPSPEFSSAQAELADRLVEALGRLSIEEREAVVLCHMAGLTQAEASQATGIDLEALKSRVRRGLGHLRGALKMEQGSVELYLAAFIFPPPHDGWESAANRWEGLARTGRLIDSPPGPVPALIKLLGVSSIALLASAGAFLFLNYSTRASLVGETPTSAQSAGASSTGTFPAVKVATAKVLNATEATEAVRPNGVPVDFDGPRPPVEPAGTYEAVSPPGNLAIGSVQVRTVYYKSGAIYQQITELLTDKGPIKQGTYTRFFLGGGVQEVGEYAANERDGIWLARHENGQLAEQGAYKSGKMTGVWSFFFDTGEKRCEGVFENDLKSGPWMYWHKNGEIRRTEYFVAGLREGVSVEFDEVGHRRRESHWLRDQKHGPETEYDDRGNHAASRTYKHGKVEN